MAIDFKLNHEPLSEGKEARYAVCTGYEKKAYTHLIYCYGDNGDPPSFLFSSLLSCKGPKSP